MTEDARERVRSRPRLFLTVLCCPLDYRNGVWGVTPASTISPIYRDLHYPSGRLINSGIELMVHVTIMRTNAPIRHGVAWLSRMNYHEER